MQACSQGEPPVLTPGCLPDRGCASQALGTVDEREDGVIIINAAGIIMACNKPLLNMFGVRHRLPLDPSHTPHTLNTQPHTPNLTPPDPKSCGVEGLDLAHQPCSIHPRGIVCSWRPHALSNTPSPGQLTA